MATLKISDLSVGDWVRDGNGIIAKVRGIENWSNGYILNVETVSGSICSLSSTGALPIPITPEILEANGFVKWQGGLVLIGDEVSCRYEDGNLTIEQGYRDNEGVLVERLLVNIECLSVHQLQHALRLAGVDKEINL